MVARWAGALLYNDTNDRRTGHLHEDDGRDHRVAANAHGRRAAPAFSRQLRRDGGNSRLRRDRRWPAVPDGPAEGTTAYQHGRDDPRAELGRGAEGARAGEVTTN